MTANDGGVYRGIQMYTDDNVGEEGRGGGKGRRGSNNLFFQSLLRLSFFPFLGGVRYSFKWASSIRPGRSFPENPKNSKSGLSSNLKASDPEDGHFTLSILQTIQSRGYPVPEVLHDNIQIPPVHLGVPPSSTIGPWSPCSEDDGKDFRESNDTV